MFNHITWCSETNQSSVKNYTLVQKFANDIFVTNKLIIQSFFSGYYLLCSNDYIFFFLNDCIVNTMSIDFFKSFLHHQSFTKLVLVLLWVWIIVYGTVFIVFLGLISCILQHYTAVVHSWFGLRQVVVETGQTLRQENGTRYILLPASLVLSFWLAHHVLTLLTLLIYCIPFLSM